ncbi:MAG: plasma-membrane proton-efflux P-type ATPase [Bacilli bacterium]|jgi:H+-transporting ATPase|nr:plasma-membrane proton-efflux P-type ATPase [Bacilli bacterium]
MELKPSEEYKGIKAKEAFADVSSTPNGLTANEAAKRLSECGPNEIAEKKRNPVLGFLKRYWGPMPWLLEFAMVLTFVVGHYVEGSLIFALLTINAVIGFVQSQHSRKAVELLKKHLEIKVKARRNGEWVVLNAGELVPGDVITLKLGDFVPADAYVFDGRLSLDASSLTGESLPVETAVSSLAYSGSVVKGGEALALVVNTGVSTSFGKTVSLVQTAQPKSKQQKLMFSIVKYMMYLGVAASLAVTIYAIAIHWGDLRSHLYEIMSLIIVFLMGAIPVALPAVMTIVQTVGATSLSKKGVLVTRLDSIEDAASIDVFCFDKTGTITQNRISVTSIEAFGGVSRDQALLLAASSSNSKEKDAIDDALIGAAKEKGDKGQSLSQISYVPFTPATKRTEAIINDGKGTFRLIKGAPQVVIGLCDGTDEKEKGKALSEVEGFSKKGFRSLALARQDGDNAPVRLIALLALSDPPRTDSEKLIANVQALGIRCLMLTGDNAAIAKEVASEVGIGSRIHSANELKGLSEKEEISLVERSDGFAEVYPEDKYEIVKLLQKAGHMVGMTGDGINDSPALKQAELGTAVSSATDVAKASASVVLTRPGLSEIVDTVKTSRQTYQRMLTWVINKITKVVEVVVLFTVGYFWFRELLISLLGMSLLVFANDFVTMSIATDNVVSDSSPNMWKLKSIVAASSGLGILFALEDLLVVCLGYYWLHLDYATLCSLTMLSLVYNTQFRIMIVRERRHFWSSAPDKKLFFISLAAMVLFTFIGIFGGIIPALGCRLVFGLLGIGLAFMVLVDFAKYALFKAFRVS